MGWRRWQRFWAEWLWRPQCGLCDRPSDAILCPDCEKRLAACQRSPHTDHHPQTLTKAHANPRANSCPTPHANARATSRTNARTNPQRPAQTSIPVWAWGNYDGDLKRAIAVLKYQGRIDLARPLGQAIADAWLGDRPDPGTLPRRDRPWVVPIPLFVAKEEQRGFNQAAELAAAFCEITGLRHAPYGLQRMRNTQAQFGLSARDRQRNLQAAFTLGPDCQNPRWWGLWPQRPPRYVILIDDIYTTGATVRTAIACLRQHHIDVCEVVVLARTLPRSAIAPPAPGSPPKHHPQPHTP